MTNLAVEFVPVVESARHANIIPFDLIRNIREQEDAKSKKPNNKIAGESSEVYAFRTKEEIAAMVDVFNKRIEESSNDDQRRIACRNKMLFIIGINIGIRASDLRTLKWSFFFIQQSDGSLKFNDSYKIQPKKQRKQGKFVTLYFNQAVKQTIENYISEYPINSLDDYLFASRKGNSPITVDNLRKIVKDAAVEAGIEQNIGSHSLRKTWGKFSFEQAEDKTRALVVLQKAFNHSDSLTTLRYIGLLDEEISDMYNSLNLGIDDMI